MTVTPQQARDRQWERAKAAYEGRSNSGFFIDGVGVIQTDGKSREAIILLKDEARERLDDGQVEWSTSFINEANEAVPVTGPQILAIYGELRAFLGECYSVCQAKRVALDAALAAGATADQIFAIDVTAGYPAFGVPAE